MQTAIGNDIGLGHSAASALEWIGEDGRNALAAFPSPQRRTGAICPEKGVAPGERAAGHARAIYRVCAAARKHRLHVVQAPVSLTVRRSVWSFWPAPSSAARGPARSIYCCWRTRWNSEGAVQVWSDPVGLLPALGTLAAVEPAAVVQLVEWQGVARSWDFDSRVWAGAGGHYGGKRQGKAR